MNEGETDKLRDNHAMKVLGIPDIVVLEPVDIDVQTVIVHVHVRHEMYSAPSSTPPF